MHVSPRRTEAQGGATNFVLLVSFVVLSTIVGRSFTALNPGTADARLFMYIGEQWLSGQIPYVDVWNNKSPGIYGVIALVFSIFPRNFVAVAAVEATVVVGAAWTVYVLVRRLGAPFMAGALAATTCAVFTNLTIYNEGGVLTEIYLPWPAALSMILFVAAFPDLRIRPLMAAGFFAGLASLFKAPGLAPFLAQATFLAAATALSKLSARVAIRCTLASLVGVLIAWAPALGYFHSHGALADLLDASFLFNVRYGAESQPGLHSIVFNLAAGLAPAASLVVGVGLLAVWLVFKLNRRGLGREQSLGLWQRTPDFAPLILLWVAFDLVGIQAGGWNYGHYYLAAAASLSTATGFVFWQVFLKSTPQGSPLLAGGVAALFVAPLLITQLQDVRQLGRLVRDGPPQGFWEGAVGAIDAVRRTEDTVFTWDYLPTIYFHTRMRSPTRFLSVPAHGSPGVRETIADAVLAALEQRPPSFIVDLGANRSLPSLDELQFDEYQAFLDRGYDVIHEEQQDYGLRVFKRRAGDAMLPAPNAVPPR